MWNRFPEKAESGSTHNRTSRFLFYFFIGFVWFLLVPLGKRTGRFVTSMQFPRSWIYFAASTLGRCSLAGGFGWSSVWWETNVAGSWHRGGVLGRALADIPGEGAFRCFPSDYDLPMNSPLPCCSFLCNKELHIFLFNPLGNCSSV